MTNRGVLIGNVMASEPVRQYISKRAGVPAEVLQVASPVTPDFPRPLATSGKKSPQRHPQVAERVSPQHPGQPDGADPRHLRRGADS